MEKRTQAAPTLVGRVLRRAGYAPQARVRELTESLARAEARVSDLKRALDDARTEIQGLKQRVHDQGEQMRRDRAEDEKRLQDRLAKLDGKARKQMERVEAHDRDRGTRLDGLREKLKEIHQQMAAADKTTQLGREHLMAVEVKLDIVEGAIRVLDQRTRSALAAAREDATGPRPTGLP